MKWKVKVKSLSGVQLFATPWTAANQAPPSMGFSRQEYWSGVPLPSLFCHRQTCIYVYYRKELTSCWICFSYFNLCFLLLLFSEGYCPYIMACFRIPCPFAWMVNQNAFIQGSVCLWVATRKKELTYPLPKTGHSRRYLQD